MLTYRARSSAWLLLRVVSSGMLGLACAVASAADTGVKPSTTGLADTQENVLDLARAWRLALQNDHTFRAALSEQAATQTERDQGRAGLLPVVQASYVRSRVSGSISQPDFTGQRVAYDLNYDSSNAYVQVQQPLLNYGRYADYQRGNARADEGNAVFEVRRQDTGIRLTTAYFGVLLAHGDLALQRSLAASLEKQAAGLEAQYRKNEGTRTDAQETRARLAVARAEMIRADDRLVVALRELQSLIGIPPRRIAAMRPEFSLAPPSGPGLQEWLTRARVNNAQVRAAREAVNVADTEISRAVSRYSPTMDLVATYGKADSENLSTLSQRTNTFTIGIQINIPIFTGGYNTANVSHARSDHRRLQRELDATLERTQIEVTRQYTNVMGGAERILALQAAVESGQLSLDSALKGFSVGAWSNLDVLRAQDRLYQAKYELIEARLEYLLARVKLHTAAGEAPRAAIESLNAAHFGPINRLAD